MVHLASLVDSEKGLTDCTLGKSKTSSLAGNSAKAKSKPTLQKGATQASLGSGTALMNSSYGAFFGWIQEACVVCRRLQDLQHMRRDLDAEVQEAAEEQHELARATGQVAES